MDKRPPALLTQRYDWPELRGLVPNSTSPPPRMTMTNYNPKPTQSSSVHPSTNVLQPNRSELPKKPMHAWHRVKPSGPAPAPMAPPPPQPAAGQHATSANTSPNTTDLAVDAPLVQPHRTAPRREVSLGGHTEPTNPLHPGGPVLSKRTIAKNPGAVLRRIYDGDATKHRSDDLPMAKGDPPLPSKQESTGPGKQWIFHMPVVAAAGNGAVLEPTGGGGPSNPPLPTSQVTFNIGSDDDGSPKDMRAARGTQKQLAQGNRTQSNGEGLVPPPRKVGGHHTKKRVDVSRVATIKKHYSGTTGAAGGWNGSLDLEDLQIEGSGVASVSSALLSLEASVAKERRAKEELAAAHTQVLQAFRQVVRSYFHSVDETMTVQRRAGPAMMPLAKCSVVVHTLLSTIQCYLRGRLSQRFAMMQKLGITRTTLAARLQLANKPLPPLLSVSDIETRGAYTPLAEHTAAEELSEAATSRSSVHDMLLDNQTIARLKQLYFDYYDCETFLIGPRGDDSPACTTDSTAQLLPMEHRDMRHVIEETNVLEEVAEDGSFPHGHSHDHDASGNEDQAIPEELPGQDAVVPLSPSILLNESRAMRDIFGSPRTASEIGSPMSCDDMHYCEVEDL